MIYLCLCGFESGMVVMLLCMSEFLCRFQTVNMIFISCVYENYGMPVILLWE